MTEFWNIRSLLKRLYEQTTQPVCDGLGLTHVELDILLFLANNPQYDTAKDIVCQRQIAKSHVSVALAGLERRGYLERSCLPGNRKTVHLRLLPAACEAVDRGNEAQITFVESLFAGFTPEESAAVQYGLEKIAGNVRAALKGED